MFVEDFFGCFIGILGLCSIGLAVMVAESSPVAAFIAGLYGLAAVGKALSVLLGI